jgi:hypothetical protein
MQGLSDATVRIGDVVHLINNIASQTNLPALYFDNLLPISVLVDYFQASTHAIPMTAQRLRGMARDNAPSREQAHRAIIGMGPATRRMD